MNIISSPSKIIWEITWSLSIKTILDKFDDMFLSSRLKRVQNKELPFSSVDVTSKWSRTHLHDPPPFNGPFFMTPPFSALSKSCDPPSVSTPSPLLISDKSRMDKFKGWLPVSRNFYVRRCLKFTFANKIEAIHERSIVSVKVEPRSTSRLSSALFIFPQFYLRD